MFVLSKQRHQLFQTLFYTPEMVLKILLGYLLAKTSFTPKAKKIIPAKPSNHFCIRL